MLVAVTMAVVVAVEVVAGSILRKLLLLPT
jgi:hypothetical protein